jgi:hypothetical protein
MWKSTFRSSARSEGKFDFALSIVALKLHGNVYNRPMLLFLNILTAAQFIKYSLSRWSSVFYCRSRRWINFSGDDICFRNLIFLRCCSNL